MTVNESDEMEGMVISNNTRRSSRLRRSQVDGGSPKKLWCVLSHD